MTILLLCKAINMQLKGALTCVGTDLKHPTYFPFNPKVTTSETQIPISWCFLIHTLVSKKKKFTNSHIKTNLKLLTLNPSDIRI